MKYEARLKAAIRHFWKTRDDQSVRQGTATGQRDAGARSAVTGGKQMDLFVELVRDLMIEAGIPDAAIQCERNLELPGYFRAEKKWDLIVVVDETLLASVEFKSQVGPSFGNNYNNRTEEALGSAMDLWASAARRAAEPALHQFAKVRWRRETVSVPRTPSLHRRGWCAWGYAVAGVAATVPGSTMLLAGRQLCGSNCARSRFFNEGRRSKTSLR